MELSNKQKIIGVSVGLVVAFACGRYSVQKPNVTTSLQSKEVSDSLENKDTHTKTTITETKQPNGADTKITVIDQVANDTVKDDSTIQTQVQQAVTQPKLNTLNISVLGANDFSKGLVAPTYGLSVTKQVLGPFTVGGFGLMNGVVGVSIGLNF